ncbi:MAG TPA: ABC transporter permease [Polyangiaceae bacterium]
MSAIAASWTSPRFRRGLVVPIVALIAWELITHYKLANVHLLASPSAVLKSFAVQVREGELFSQLLASLRRDLSGFALGAFAGLLLGSAMGVWRIADRLFGPSFDAAKQVAVFAWIPLISVWCGTGEFAKVVFIALAAFYPVVVNAYEGIRSVSREHLEVARAFRFTRLQTFKKVVLPAALPSIFSGLHLALIYSWLGTLGAEYLLAPAPGIGNLMIDGREALAMDKVLLGVILAGLVGFSLNTAAARAEAYFLRWRVRNT